MIHYSGPLPVHALYHQRPAEDAPGLPLNLRGLLSALQQGMGVESKHTNRIESTSRIEISKARRPPGIQRSSKAGRAPGRAASGCSCRRESRTAAPHVLFSNTNFTFLTSFTIVLEQLFVFYLLSNKSLWAGELALRPRAPGRSQGAPCPRGCSHRTSPSGS